MRTFFRTGSSCYFNTIEQGRKFYKMGLGEAVNEEERDMLENTNLGEWAMFEGEEVLLDFPMYEETLKEAQALEEKKRKRRRKRKILRLASRQRTPVVGRGSLRSKSKDWQDQEDYPWRLKGWA